MMITRWYYNDVVGKPTMERSLLCAVLALPAIADKLHISTAPPGAAVQINSLLVGTEQSIPGGYLDKTKTSLGPGLEDPMVARLTLDGHAAKEIEPTRRVDERPHRRVCDVVATRKCRINCNETVDCTLKLRHGGSD
jgi:hypothetical protein